MHKKIIILVTGGAGFIGSHLCESLSKDTSNNVYSLDDYSTGSVNNHVDGVIYIAGKTSDIESLVDFKVDIVFHLGEYSRVEQSFSEIEKVWRSNIEGTFALLEFIRKYKSRLIYAGSSTKFCDGEIGKYQSPYAWSKYSNTELVKNYGKWYGIDYAIVYFYNVYGGREISSGKYATLIAIFKEKYEKGTPLTVVKPGTQRRNFTHVDDIINGLILVGESGEGDGYGIGCNKSFTILDIANMFGSEVVMLPERKGNREDGDLVVLKTKELGWSSRISVEDYIREILSE